MFEWIEATDVGGATWRFRRFLNTFLGETFARLCGRFAAAYAFTGSRSRADN